MRAVTLLLWALAGFLLVVAVRSHDRSAAARAAVGEPDQPRSVPRMFDPRDGGRVGPCWDDVARELLQVGDDRWLGVGCDVEGAPRRGESPECTQLRKRITACLHGERRPRDPWSTEHERARKLHDPGCGSCGGHWQPAGGSRPVPNS